MVILGHSKRPTHVKFFYEKLNLFDQKLTRETKKIAGIKLALIKEFVNSSNIYLHKSMMRTTNKLC